MRKTYKFAFVFQLYMAADWNIINLCELNALNVTGVYLSHKLF